MCRLLTSGLSSTNSLCDIFKCRRSGKLNSSLGNWLSLLWLRFNRTSFSNLPISGGRATSALSCNCSTVRVSKFSIFGEMCDSEFELRSRLFNGTWFHQASSSFMDNFSKLAFLLSSSAWLISYTRSGTERTRRWRWIRKGNWLCVRITTGIGILARLCWCHWVIQFKFIVWIFALQLVGRRGHLKFAYLIETSSSSLLKMRTTHADRCELLACSPRGRNLEG